jgi:hypothetical protein
MKEREQIWDNSPVTFFVDGIARRDDRGTGNAPDTHQSPTSDLRKWENLSRRRGPRDRTELICPRAWNDHPEKSADGVARRRI